MNSTYTGLSRIIERNAQTFGHSPAIICEHETRTWQQTQDRIASAAAGLGRMGVQKNDKIALLGLNSDCYFEFLYIPAWLGAICVPLNIRWSLSENMYALEDSDATVLVFDDAFIEIAGALKDKCPHIKNFIHIGQKECPEWAVPYIKLWSEFEAIPSTPTGGEDVAYIMYTGGTTGLPKGVMQSHNGFFVSSMSIAMDLKLESTDIFMHAAPMFHVADCGVGMAATIVGAAQTFVPSFTPAAVLNTIQNSNVTFTILVPTMIKMMIEHTDFHQADLSSLKKLIYGASPMQESVALKTIEGLPHTKLYQAYGQTELSPIATVSMPSDHEIGNPRMRSAGRATFCTNVRIRLENGQLAHVGQVGEVEVSGPNVMLGYLNKPEITQETLIDGYVKTGDAGYLDEGGYLFLVDRVKDMIITGGENVFSSEVESILSLHPAVNDVVVIGIPNEQWGEQVHAIVILSPDQKVDEKELQEFCKEKIAGYKCPKSIEYRTEAFPLSSAGKVLKVTIREPYWKNHEKMVN
ncbi:long-chain-fatty-acid--CoA ligase [Temperatibacter marinus]|uniref:3-methylmercaptopropionyl-CoA ligase n=1 Tax=Temperatibacter marinus TaxID=1456591 RepID=A0AA52HAU2_9PROT|nr:long-chain-fatty-acid--CoA ligase [Temperatibacter marinus]WND02963.1 long-chain-fatty-acid--CoA ligase [Temperatibacter marinus]